MSPTSRAIATVVIAITILLLAGCGRQVPDFVFVTPRVPTCAPGRFCGRPGVVRTFRVLNQSSESGFARCLVKIMGGDHNVVGRRAFTIGPIPAHGSATTPSGGQRVNGTPLGYKGSCRRVGSV
jgi:hypothetical protein